MTPREQAYILRLAAIELTGEWGAHNLRDTLHRLGWDDAAIDGAVARVKRALWRQAELFKRAA
jgi:hypothetical protein